MTDEGYVLPEREILESNITRLLSLLSQEENLELEPEVDKKINMSLDQAFNPEKFEIVFAGRYSTGKSMLINCLLERYFLKASVGHATAVECRILYAKDSESEGVKLTYFNRQEVLDKLNKLSQDLNLIPVISSLDDQESLKLIKVAVNKIKNDPQQAAQKETAEALEYLIDGFDSNSLIIEENNNYQTPLRPLEDSKKWATDKSLCAVLKKIDYFCFHPLLKECTIVDLPGIDAPTAKDKEIAINKIQSDTTAAVVLVLGYVKGEGETLEVENEIVSTISNKDTLRNRTFYIMNRVDELWNNPALQEKCDQCIDNLAYQIHNNRLNRTRIYQVSAILDFYTSIFKDSDENSQYGLKEFATKGNIDALKPFLDAFVQFFKKFYIKERQPNTIDISISASEEEYYQKIRSEPEFSSITDEILNQVGIIRFKSDLEKYLTEDKKPELYSILSHKIEQLSYQLVQCYEQQSLDINSIAIDSKGIINEHKSIWRNQLKEIYNQIEITFNNQVRKISRLEPDGSSNYLKFEALLIEINNYATNDILETRINEISFKEVLNQAKEKNKNKPVPRITIISESILLIMDEVEQYVVEQVLNFLTEFLDDLKSEIRRDSADNKLGENFRTEINKRIFKLLDFHKRSIQAAIRTGIARDCDDCRKEHPNFFTKIKDIELENLFKDKLNVENEQQIRELLQAQFQQNFEDIFNQGQDSGVRRTILSTFVRLLRINNGKLGEGQEALDLEQELELEELVETKLETDLSQEITNRQEQKVNRIKALNIKIGEYLQLKEEVETCFNSLETNDSNYQLPKIEKITSNVPETENVIYN